jgi:hypothetical protein
MKGTSKSKSKSHYSWRSVSLHIKVSSPLWDLWPDITFCPKVAVWKLLSCLCEAPSPTRGRRSRSRSHVTTDGQSVIMSRYRTHSETCDQIFLSVRRLLSESCCLESEGRHLWREVVEVEVTLQLMVMMSMYRAHSEICDHILFSVRRLLSQSCCLVSVGRPLWREVGFLICNSQSIVICQYLHQPFTLRVFYSSEFLYNTSWYTPRYPGIYLSQSSIRQRHIHPFIYIYIYT